MDYGKIITRAFSITLRHRFLWWLGMLAALTEGFSIPSFNPGGGNAFPPQWREHYHSHSPVTSLLGDTRLASAEYAPFSAEDFRWLLDWVALHLLLIIVIAALLLLIGIALFVISVMARGGLISSVVGIEKQQPVSFGIGFRAGYQAFWRIFGMNLLLGLILLALIAIFATPIVILCITKHILAGIILGLFSALLIIVVLIYLGVMLLLATRFIVLHACGVMESITHAHKLVMAHKVETLLVWLLALAIGIGLAIALIIVVCLLVLPLGIIGVIVYKLMGVLATVIVAGVFALLLLAALLLLTGITNTFSSSYWTLAFLELTKPPVLLVEAETQPAA